MPEIKMYEGDAYADDRGRISFVNDFTFKEVKRCYHIMHPRTEIIRAWQGHRIEHKYFFVPHGKFLLAWVCIDDWNAPSVHLKATYSILSEDEPRVLCIPPGYANGIKALTPGSVLSVYSDLDLAASEKDRWSFDQSLWLDWSLF
jgi:dTDP-4-dehydrorhamnose 3,5-epimerase